MTTADIGYGTGAGFKGYNCRHDWFPFFEDISEKAYSDKELEQRKNETVTYEGKEMSRYDAEQKQRAMERQIRKERSKLAALDTAIKSTDDEELKTRLKNDFDNLSVKLKSHEAKYKDFSYKTGLPPQKQRLQMYGFNRSVSQKAVHRAKNPTKKIVEQKPTKQFTSKPIGDTIREEFFNQEDFDYLKKVMESPDDGIPEDVNFSRIGSNSFSDEAKTQLYRDERIISGNRYETAILYDSNGSRIFTKKVVSDEVTFTNSEIKKMKGGILTHNHPNGGVFSPEDLNMLRKGHLSEIRACNGDGVYIFRRGENWSKNLPDFNSIKKAYYDTYAEKGMKYRDIAAQEGKHFFSYYSKLWEDTMSTFAEKYGFEFRKEIADGGKYI